MKGTAGATDRLSGGQQAKPPRELARDDARRVTAFHAQRRGAKKRGTATFDAGLGSGAMAADPLAERRLKQKERKRRKEEEDDEDEDEEKEDEEESSSHPSSAPPAVASFC